MAADRGESHDFFERHVRPVLASICLKCHGDDEQSGGLRVDSRQSLLRGGHSGPALIPGNVDESLLVAAIRREGDLQMPPKSKLTDQEIDSLIHWVRIGAPWPAAAAVDSNAASVASHWAFQPVRRPPLPTAEHDRFTSRNPIDRFVNAKLAAAGLEPSPPADRRTLLRRVTYDLTGLPPTVEEVETFVRDEGPDAYARRIDLLLASTHFGEQWARHWLDVARYSDTKGYVYGREERFWVHAWSYRDWVVRAMNMDMPYDRFLLLQIAADQAAADDSASWAAMGFLTIGRRFLGVTTPPSAVAGMIAR